MALNVEIDPRSGFCGGVIRAIHSAEEYLSRRGGPLYSLGSIVHNERELARLSGAGLVTVHDISEVPKDEDATLLIRAHGEPPVTYERARCAGVSLIDCTCPVVLKLQKHIREAYSRVSPRGGQVVIFGKVGHAEVLGLVGQTEGEAVVVENMQMLQAELSDGKIRLDAPLEVFSQTTKSPSEYESICAEIRSRIDAIPGGGPLRVHDTICRQVASRHEQLGEFARSHDAIVFVTGKESSNGKVLCEMCRRVNPRTYAIGDCGDILLDWFRDGEKVGVCGATSTPKWLLEEVASTLQSLF